MASVAMINRIPTDRKRLQASHPLRCAFWYCPRPSAERRLQSA